MITCFIRYEIEPFKREAYGEYAANWNRIIPRLGPELIGYYAPHEGSLTTGYGLYNIDSLAAYEAYKTKLAADPEARANLDLARREGFIRREDRIFLRRVT